MKVWFDAEVPKVAEVAEVQESEKVSVPTVSI